MAGVQDKVYVPPYNYPFLFEEGAGDRQALQVFLDAAAPELPKSLNCFLAGGLPSEGQTARINVKVKLSRTLVFPWRTTYVDKTLYIEAPPVSPVRISREAFVNVLEYADEVLLCNRAILYFNSDREKKEKDSMVNTFMYQGLWPIPQENVDLPFREIDGKVYMVCNFR